MDMDRAMALAQNPRMWIGVVLVVVLVVIVRRLFGGQRQSPHLTTSRCKSCGWTGQVSKFKPVCPRCAKPIAL